MQFRNTKIVVVVLTLVVGLESCIGRDETTNANASKSLIQQTPGTKLCAEANIREDKAQNLYYMDVRGMTFPFRTAPCREASNVWIESPGNDPAGELGEALLRRGTQIVLVSDSKDGNKTSAALDEIELYLRQASTNKPIREVLPDGSHNFSKHLEHIRNDKSKTIVLALGPGSGAQKTRVSVEKNLVRIEGTSYRDVTRAADRAVLELAAVFCGTKTCSDPVACSQGKSCGCKNRKQ